MWKLVLTVAAGLLATTALTRTAGGQTIDALQWTKRIVIVFAEAGAPALEEQRTRLLRDEAALAERDILAFAAVGDELRPIYGTLPAGETAEGLRQRFAIASSSEFAVILIGKDGGVKWRQPEPVDAAELNEIIDAMPMRRAGR